MTKLLSIVAGWKFKLGLIVLVLGSAYFWHVSRLNKAVDKAKQEYLVESTLQYHELTKEAYWTSVQLKNKFVEIEKEKDAKLQNLTNRVAVLNASLHNRKTRDESRSSVSRDTGTKESTGFVDASRLYREDAAVAIWFATRTEGLKISLQECYDKYDSVKQTLEEFKIQNNYK